MRGVPVLVLAILGGLDGRAGAAAWVGARLRAQLAASRLGGTDGEVAVSVQVDGGAPRLRAAGFRPFEAVGEQAWLRVRADAIDRLARLPGVRAIRPVLRLRPSLDVSAAAVGAPAVRAQLGFDGRGVAVASIDTGCDFRHRDFLDEHGGTRFAAILDLSTLPDGRHADLPAYGGAIWLREEIQAQLDAEAAGRLPKLPVSERDVDGHGSHVLGILAGNGRATGRGRPAGRYVGIAPAATLLCAKASRDGHSFDEGDVVTAVRFALDRAGALGLPVAVDLSLSAEGGPHDGTTALERALDALFADPGRVLAVAAGNDGARDHHAGGNLLDGRIEVPILMPFAEPGVVGLDVDLWYSGGPLAVSMVAPDGSRFGPATIEHAIEQPAAAGEVILDAGGPPDGETGRREGSISLRGLGGRAPAGGTWTLVLEGTAARWDGWMTGVPSRATAPRFLGVLDGDDRGQTPAFAGAAIAVGSFATKQAWTTALGSQVGYAGATPGATSSFTGTGPTADGRFFPDLAAPGQLIASSMSRDAPADAPGSAFVYPGVPGGLVADDGVHGLLQGTSQAAPHVAGAAAVLLQIDPTLTGTRVRELLRASAALAPSSPGFSTTEGFGRLDLARAVRLLLSERGPGSAGAVDPAASTVGLSRDAAPPGGPPVYVSVVPRDALGAPLGPGRRVSIEGRDTRAARDARFRGPVRDLGGGRYERTLLAEGPRDAAFAIAVSVDGVALSARPTVWLVASRDEIDRPFFAGGGCALGSRARAAPIALALLALYGFFRRRARPGNPRARRRAQAG